MTDNESTRPLLFLDVDGPLNPYGAAPHERPQGYVTHRMRPTGWEDPSTKPLRVWLDHRHGEQLLALPYQLVWATTWMNEANEWIGPQAGPAGAPVRRLAGREPADRHPTALEDAGPGRVRRRSSLRLGRRRAGTGGPRLGGCSWRQPRAPALGQSPTRAAPGRLRDARTMGGRTARGGVTEPQRRNVPGGRGVVVRSLLPRPARVARAVTEACRTGRCCGRCAPTSISGADSLIGFSCRVSHPAGWSRTGQSSPGCWNAGAGARWKHASACHRVSA